jgi:hypothetical protein
MYCNVPLILKGREVIFYAGKTHNRLFRGAKTRKTQRNRRPCLLPAYKHKHHKLLESAVLYIGDLCLATLKRTELTEQGNNRITEDA